jgi:arsenate reductase
VAETPLWRRLTAEFIGSAFLAAVVIGSGIAAQQLSPGNTGLGLLENAAAAAAGLFALILMVGPVSGAHFNPVVSFVDAAFGGMSWRATLWRICRPRWPDARPAPCWPT